LVTGQRQWLWRVCAESSGKDTGAVIRAPAAKRIILTEFETAAAGEGELQESMNGRKRVLILCTGNSARSQMAEGLLRNDGADRYEVFSAGTHPSYVRPEAITVMSEIGIDISTHRSKSVDEFAGQDFDFVITVCDNAKENCPFVPAKTECVHWSIADPAATEGSDEERLAAFRRIRDELCGHLQGVLQEQNHGNTAT
jgi:arsenate reductase (thioredoxin)